MSSYLTPDQILGQLPAEWRSDALVDSVGESTPDQVWEELQSAVNDDLAGALMPAYDLPDPDADSKAVPLLAKVRSTARLVTLATLYRRRGVTDAENPWAKSASDAMKDLRALGQKEMTGPTGPPRNENSGTIKVIGEPALMTRSAGSTAARRRGLRGC